MKKLSFILLLVFLASCEKQGTGPQNLEDFLSDRMIIEIITNPSGNTVFFLSAIIDENAPPYICSLPLIYQLSCTDSKKAIYFENLHGIYRIAADDANNIYACQGSKLIKFLPSHDSMTIKQISSGFSCLDIDVTGNIWAGTWNEGLYMYSGNNWLQYTAANSLLPEGNVSDICCSNEHVTWALVTNEQSYIVRITDGNWNVFQYDEQTGEDYIYLSSFTADKHGNAYISYTQSGTSYLKRVDENGISEIQLPTLIRNKNLTSLNFDSEDNLYFVNNNQDFSEIWCSKNNGWEQVHTDNSINYIHDIEFDSAGYLWIGTGKGAFKIIP
ncbi:MAG: hypothetical protein JXB00_16685 [Bacteroidales bacterium]|nr:hypothetical protein [Bacteroidales bacterium]